MKTLKVTKGEYDDFLYPAVAANTAKDLQELRLASRVLDILESKGVHPGRVNGKPVETGFKLKVDEAVFELEDHQAELVAGRLEACIPNMQAWRAREVLPLIDQLRKEPEPGA